MSISNEVYVSDGLPFRQQYAFASDFEGGSIFSRSRNYSGYIGKENERVGHGGVAYCCVIHDIKLCKWCNVSYELGARSHS